MTELTDEAELEIRCLLSDDRFTTCPYRKALKEHFDYSTLSTTCAYRKILKLEMRKNMREKSYDKYINEHPN